MCAIISYIVIGRTSPIMSIFMTVTTPASPSNRRHYIDIEPWQPWSPIAPPTPPPSLPPFPSPHNPALGKEEGGWGEGKKKGKKKGKKTSMSWRHESWNNGDVTAMHTYLITVQDKMPFPMYMYICILEAYWNLTRKHLEDPELLVLCIIIYIYIYIYLG